MTITAMAQDYVGSNNINLLLPNGQFGTRIMGGKDSASPRYIFTALSPLARLVFPEADDPILEYHFEDGQKIEPRHYVPVIPLVLVNGADGIGTGWSTHVPNFCPRDVIANIRLCIEGQQEDLEPLVPWWRGYEGHVSVGRAKGKLKGKGAILCLKIPF